VCLCFVCVYISDIYILCAKYCERVRRVRCFFVKGEGEKSSFFFFFFSSCVFSNSSYLNSRARKDTRGSRFKTFTGGKKKRFDVERTRRFVVCDRFWGRSCGRIRFKIHRLVVGFLSVSSVFRGKKSYRF
jgi:hypothetical protein